MRAEPGGPSGHHGGQKSWAALSCQQTEEVPSPLHLALVRPYLRCWTQSWAPQVKRHGATEVPREGYQVAKGQEHPRVTVWVTGHQHGLPREARESLFLETLKSHLVMELGTLLSAGNGWEWLPKHRCQDIPGPSGLFVGWFGPLRGL